MQHFINPHKVAKCEKARKNKSPSSVAEWQSDGGGRQTASSAVRGHSRGICHGTVSFHFVSFFYVAHDCVPAHSPFATPLFLLLLFIIEQSYYISAPSRLVFPLHHYSAPVYVPMPLFTYATSKTKPDALRHVLIIRLQPSSGNADSVGSLFSSISTKSTKNERCYLPSPASLN